MGKRGPTAPAPTKPMDDKMFAQLVGMIRIQCTAEEISGVLGMSVDTLDTRLKERGEANFSGLHKKHSGEGKASLRRMQWKSAEDGNVTAQIWLGKQTLGQRDKNAITGEEGGAVKIEDVTKQRAEAFTSAIVGLASRIGEAKTPHEFGSGDES